MNTFIVKTKMQEKTHRMHETFVVVAANEQDAEDMAIVHAHAGAKVSSIERVTTIKRTHVGN